MCLMMLPALSAYVTVWRKDLQNGTEKSQEYVSHIVKMTLICSEF